MSVRYHHTDFEIGGVYQFELTLYGTEYPPRLARVLDVDFINNTLVYAMLSEGVRVPHNSTEFENEVAAPAMPVVSTARMTPVEDNYGTVWTRWPYPDWHSEIFMSSSRIYKYKLLLFFAAKLVALAHRANARVAHRTFAPGALGYLQAAANFEAHVFMQQTIMSAITDADIDEMVKTSADEFMDI